MVDEIDEDRLLEGINWLALSHDHQSNKVKINKAKMFEANNIAKQYIQIYKKIFK